MLIILLYVLKDGIRIMCYQHACYTAIHIGHQYLCLVSNVVLCRISCPECKVGINAFVCFLQHVGVTGREHSVNN